jgi:hypothetical protein
MKNKTVLTTNTTTLPAVAIRSVGTGLLMMTVFTGIWAGIAYGAGLSGSHYQWLLLVFLVIMILFIIQGIWFFGIARKYPAIQSAEDAAEGKKMGMWFGIIFGAEGLFIFLAVNLVRNLGHSDLIIPVIALVVGLHFYPLGRIFKRKIDYWLATWTTLVALLGILFALNKTFSFQGIAALVGIGVAIATSSYGIYMIYYGKTMIKANPF